MKPTFKMESQTRIQELASIIDSRTSAIDSYLKSENLSSPSFSAGMLPILPLPDHLRAAQDEIWEASVELQALVVGPLQYLTRITNPTVSVSMTMKVLMKVHSLKSKR